MQPPDPRPREEKAAPSWPLLIALSAVITGTAALMEYNTVYTQGEVMQLFYRVAVAGVSALLLMGLANRAIAAWLTLLCGGSLILWQANQSRRWAMLHEEVTAIVAHVNAMKSTKGQMPPDLSAYNFRHPELQKQISYSFNKGKLFLSYYLNDRGISYWYHEDSGFGYYPD